MFTSIAAVLCLSCGPWGSLALAEPLLRDAELKDGLERLGEKNIKLAEDVQTQRLMALLNVDSPRTLLVGVVREHLAPAAAVQRFSQTYGVSPTAARGVLSAVLLAEQGRRMQLLPASLDRALLALQVAAKEAPDSLIPAAAFLSDGTLMERPSALVALREILRAAPQPADRAVKLVPGVVPPMATVLWTFALGERPDLLPVALESLGVRPNSQERCVFLLSALDSPVFPDQVLSRNALRVTLVHCFLREQLSGLALQQLEALPVDAQEALRGQAGTREDIAAAFLVRGEKDRARVWALEAEALTRLRKEVSSGAGGADETCEQWFKSEVLDALLSSQPLTDAFPLIQRRACMPWEHPWSLLTASVFARQYSSYSRKLLKDTMQRVAFSGDAPADDAGASLPFIKNALSSIRAESARRKASYLEALAALSEMSSDNAASALDALSQRLEATRLGVFTERTAASKTPPSKAPSSVVTVPVASLTLPERFRPLLAQRLAPNRFIVVALSQMLDPSGEVSGGGYWVLLSRDNGRSWSEQLYTGLRPYEPFVLAVEGHGPVLERNTLRFEVVRRELVHDSITFPPVELAFREDSRRRVLEAKLDNLRLDSDHDSLPDVIEERMLLDPKRADSDGDGLSDGVDPLPRAVQTLRGKDARTEVLARFFSGMSNEECSASPGQKLVGKRMAAAPIPVERTLFVEATPSDMAGATAPCRIITVSSAEAEVLLQHLGAFYGLSFDLFFNAAGDRAELEWDRGWYGGAFSATWTETDGWTLVMTKSWIS
ncbi:hypothetical protein JGU66_28105 [Myxococcaceae bacterium JPH2]|nr:hypothetical protein [Myxococcaceae bacterium JPH2]